MAGVWTTGRARPRGHLLLIFMTLMLFVLGAKLGGAADEAVEFLDPDGEPTAMGDDPWGKSGGGRSSEDRVGGDKVGRDSYRDATIVRGDQKNIRRENRNIYVCQPGANCTFGGN